MFPGKFFCPSRLIDDGADADDDDDDSEADWCCSEQLNLHSQNSLNHGLRALLLGFKLK